jgi:hypothetical protein
VIGAQRVDGDEDDRRGRLLLTAPCDDECTHEEGDDGARHSAGF